MSLAWSTGLDILTNLNFTSNCTTATTWYRERRSSWLKDGTIGRGNETVNISFMRSAWPTGRESFDFEVIYFYDSISVVNPESWIQQAFTQIESTCLARDLAMEVLFYNLRMTSHCQSTANLLVNTVCVVNPDSLKGQDALAFPELTSLNGQRMIRDAWPYDSSNITDTELLAWARLKTQEYITFLTGPQTAAICQACKSDFCRAAGFSGNPDIAGIGVSQTEPNAVLHV